MHPAPHRRAFQRPRPRAPVPFLGLSAALVLLLALLLPALSPPAAASILAVNPGPDFTGSDFTGPNSTGPNSTAAHREVVLPMLSYVEYAGGETAGYALDLYRVLVSRNPEPRVRIGFFEDLPGGAGPLLRQSGWIAALVATRLAGVPLDEVSIAYDLYDYIDGPSAGAIMTVAVLAGLLEHEVNLDTLITGAINPDGTIGPVGGIAEKLRAAAAAGHRTVLIPLGQRFESQDGGRPVNLYALGRELGIEVREVGDIYEAYAAITGQELPRLAPPAGILTELPRQAWSAYRSAYQQAAGRVRKALQDLAALGQQPDERVAQYLLDGERAAARGRPALAYAYMHWAEQLALEQLTIARLGLEQAMEGGAAEALSAALDELSTALDGTSQGVEDLWTAVRDPGPDLAAVPWWLHLYGLLWEAQAATQLGYEALSGAEELLEQPRWRRGRQGWDGGLEAAGGYLLDAAYWYSLAEALRARAGDSLALATAVPKFGRAPEIQTVTRLARVQQAAAYAVLEYFDRLWLDDIALQDGLHLDVVREMFMAEDPDYALAAMLAYSLPTPDEEDPYLVLAGAMRIYHTMSLLINYYYSLLDAEGAEETSSLHEERLDHMLRLAEKNALAAVAAAWGLGVEPVLSLAYVEMASSLRQGDPADRVTAVSAYWLAELMARILAELSR